MKILTQKEFQADLAKLWSEAVHAEYKAQIEAAVLAEREACAKYLDDQNTGMTDMLAAEIRARSEK